MWLETALKLVYVFDVFHSYIHTVFKAVRNVIVRDTTAPVISVSGGSTVYINQGSAYQDAGATVEDTFDPSPLLLVLGLPLATTTPGVFNVTYTASDSSSNMASKVRTVVVLDEAMESAAFSAAKNTYAVVLQILPGNVSVGTIDAYTAYVAAGGKLPKALFSVTFSPPSSDASLASSGSSGSSTIILVVIIVVGVVICVALLLFYGARKRKFDSKVRQDPVVSGSTSSNRDGPSSAINWGGAQGAGAVTTHARGQSPMSYGQLSSGGAGNKQSNTSYDQLRTNVADHEYADTISTLQSKRASLDSDGYVEIARNNIQGANGIKLDQNGYVDAKFNSPVLRSATLQTLTQESDDTYVEPVGTLPKRALKRDDMHATYVAANRASQVDFGFEDEIQGVYEVPNEVHATSSDYDEFELSAHPGQLVYADAQLEIERAASMLSNQVQLVYAMPDTMLSGFEPNSATDLDADQIYTVHANNVANTRRFQHCL